MDPSHCHETITSVEEKHHRLTEDLLETMQRAYCGSKINSIVFRTKYVVHLGRLALLI
jgi:hydroxyacyl-ACP dehydratase HTD2-like protein with hotdog domain